jgi:hypothetical protein
LKADTFYLSKNERDQWISYDFCKSRIKPTHYSIRSRYDSAPGRNNLRSWVIEGSIDGSNWIEIDRRDNNNELNGKNISGQFAISHPDEFRMIRLRQTGKNHAGHDHLTFSAFEIFGTFLESLK